MTAELGVIPGLSAFVILSVVALAWRLGRVEGRMAGVRQSVERLHADINRLRDNMDGLREDDRAILLRLPAKPE